jgi:hypothetical protein
LRLHLQFHLQHHVVHWCHPSCHEHHQHLCKIQTLLSKVCGVWLLCTVSINPLVPKGGDLCFLISSLSILIVDFSSLFKTRLRSSFPITFRSSEVGRELRSELPNFETNFRTSKRNWELGNELRNRVLKSELKSTIS